MAYLFVTLCITLCVNCFSWNYCKLCKWKFISWLSCFDNKMFRCLYTFSVSPEICRESRNSCIARHCTANTCNICPDSRFPNRVVPRTLTSNRWRNPYLLVLTEIANGRLGAIIGPGAPVFLVPVLQVVPWWKNEISVWIEATIRLLKFVVFRVFSLDVEVLSWSLLVAVLCGRARLLGGL